MGKAYRDAHPNEPYDLSDTGGIADELAQEAVSDAKEAASNVVDKVSEKVSEAAETISRTAKYAYDQSAAAAETGLRRAERTVRDNPLNALLITAGITFAVGALLGRSRRDRNRAYGDLE
jgi:ElaB/YqjD/DUF883 family membrane-anchored ribosome-binding protein